MSLFPKAQTGAAAQPSELVQVVEREELAAAYVRRDALTTQVAQARAEAEQITRQLHAAEADWERAATHTRTDAQLLQTLRDEAAPLVAQAAAVAHQLEEVEGVIATLKHHDERERARLRAEELWPPTCRALVEPVRKLIPAIRAQQAIWEQLVEEQVHGSIERETELGWGIDLLPELGRWLAVAERSGLTKGR